MFRVGLLGVGDAGAHHARALVAAHAEGIVQWSAVGARDIVKTAAKCKDLGMPADTRVVSPDELFTGELCEALIIATPDGLHFEHAMLAYQAGMHVLVEKPIALTMIQASDLVAAARTKDRVLMVGYHLRHHAGHALVLDRLAERVGTLRTLSIRWAWPDPAVDGWRAHGENARWWALAALGTHAIDLALYFAGAPITEAHAVREPQHGIDRAAEVVMRHGNGALAHISVAVTHRARSMVSLVGDKGEVECVGTLGARGAGAIVHRTEGGELPVVFVPENPYLRQLRAFVARCKNGDSRIDAHAITNLELLHRITPS